MSTSLDVTPCVSFLSSLSHYSPHLTLGLVLKWASPSSLKLSCLIYLLTAALGLACSAQALRSGLQTLIVARGLQSPGTQKLQRTSLFALQPVGSF